MTVHSTLTAAAHDTTPNALARIFWHLGQDQRVQDKLREEILCAQLDLTNDPAQLYDQIIALPYLDAVLRETLRLHSPVSMLQRRYDPIALNHMLYPNHSCQSKCRYLNPAVETYHWRGRL